MKDYFWVVEACQLTKNFLYGIEWWNFVQKKIQKCFRVIALKLLIISKNVSHKSFSVREGRHTGSPYFFIGGGANATSRSSPLFKMEPCIFFRWHYYRFWDESSDLPHKVILVTQSMKIVEKSFSFLFISYDTHDNTHR